VSRTGTPGIFLKKVTSHYTKVLQINNDCGLVACKAISGGRSVTGMGSTYLTGSAREASTTPRPQDGGGFDCGHLGAGASKQGGVCKGDSKSANETFRTG